MNFLIAVPVENKTTANNLAAANFSESFGVFSVEGSPTGTAPATHVYCGATLDDDAKVKVLQLLQVVNGQMEVIDDSNPFLSFQKLNLKPIVIEK